MARDFDGTADYLEATSAPATALPVTLVCWMRTDQTTTSSVALCVGTNGGNGRVQVVYQGAVANDPVAAQSISSDASGVEGVSGVTPGTAWFHAAAVFTSTTSRRAFVNGVGGTTNTTSNDPGASGWNRTLVGARRNSTSIGAYYDGAIAEAAIYNVALSESEIEQLANGYSPLMVRPQSLAFYAPLFGRAGASGNEEDWAGSATLTQSSSPALADHPRIIYPRRRIAIPFSAAAATAPTLSDLRAINVGATSTQWSIDYAFS